MRVLLRHGFQYLLARGLPGVLNFVAIAVYTRLLNPEQYGAYALTIATVSAADSLLLLWLRLSLLRFLPMEGQSQPTTLATILRLHALLSLGVAVLAVLIGWLLVQDDVTRQLVLLGACLFAVQGAFELTVERERSDLSPKRYGYYAGLKALFGLAIGTALAAAGMGAGGLLIGLVIAMLLPLIILGGGARWLGSLQDNYDPQLARRIAVYGMPLAATSLLAFLVTGSDRFMLAAYIDTAAAGQYVVGYDLAQFTLGLLLSIVNLAAYPLIVSTFEKKGEEAAQRMLRWTLQLFLLVGLPATVGLSMLAPNIAAVMIGDEFQAAATMVIPGITIAALLAGLKAFYLDLAFQLRGNTIVQVWILLITAVLNIGLNVVFIPWMGLLGAVYSAVAAHAVAIILSWILGRNALRLPLPDRTAGPIVVATLLMFGGLMLVRGFVGPVALVGQVALGVFLFGACLLLIDKNYFRKLMAHAD